MPDQQPSTSATDTNPPVLRLLAKRARKITPVQIKTTTTHSVCLEQQIFFKEVIEAIMGSDDSKRAVSFSTKFVIFCICQKTYLHLLKTQL
jgi:hypothetical protein